MSSSPLFYLNKLDSSTANSVLPSISLNELFNLSGKKLSCFIFNYMFDFEWLYSILPDLNYYKDLNFIGQSDCINNVFF